MMKKLNAFAVAAMLFSGITLFAQSKSPLELVAKYNMPPFIQGRFDHLGIDLKADRLYLAAETAHKVLVFNLKDGKYLRAIPNIEIPHAIFVRDDLNRIYITDGGLGALRIYDSRTYKPLKVVPLKKDADSIGYDPRTHLLYIDDGGGDAQESFSMLTAVDTTSEEKVADIKIDGKTLEAMALESGSPKMYVNNAAKNQIEVIDRRTRKVLASWPVTLGSRNVAMALDETNHRLFVACRSGAIVVFDTRDGKELQALPIAKGVDDLIFDPASKRLYASCGGGNGATFIFQEKDPDHYRSVGTVTTGPGAKNELLIPSRNLYFVVVPPRADVHGQVYVYRVRSGD
jgi:DNA-binding beta-propeller fold protein YncE